MTENNSGIGRCVTIALALWSVALSGTGTEAQSAGQMPADEPYSVSFAAGAPDDHGNFLGGTEVVNVVPFGGKLYAGVGYWMDRPKDFDSNDPRSAAQVLVLDSRTSQWRQEYAFDAPNENGGFKHHRPISLQPLRFHRFDGAGNVVGTLAEMLAVGLDAPIGAVYTQSSPGRWEDTRIPTTSPVRSLAVRYDPVDKVERIYAGEGGTSEPNNDHAIFSGVYDPSAPGRIRWNPNPEATSIKSRIMSFTTCGGALFASAKPSIFRRNDTMQRWDPIYSYPMAEDHDRSKFASGFRGLTCINDASTGGKPMLLTGFEGVSGDIVRIDPASGAATVELNTRRYLTEQWGAGPIRPDIIAGYNDAPSIRDQPQTRVFGLLVGAPNETERDSAWFLSRTPATPPTYELHRVSPLRWPNPRSETALWSVRTIVVSPFPEDHGQVLYLGGYDGHFRPDHNTAWLYRVGIDTALGRYQDAKR